MIVNKKIWKSVFWSLIGIFVFVNVVFLKVILHEFGHYIAAESYGLEPEIELNLESVGDLRFNFEAQPLASTSFLNTRDSLKLFVIVLLGPFMNLILGIVFLVCFVFLRSNVIREMALIGFIVSMGSFIMNILPFSGSDGSLIFWGV